MALQFFRQLYSLDTLDTRFIVPATAPPKEALKEAELDPAGPLPTHDGRGKGKGGDGNVQLPRWNTPEFYVYYVSISASIFMMFKLVLQVSQGWCIKIVELELVIDPNSITSNLSTVFTFADGRVDTWT
jgi:hypothetical protein